MKRKEENVSNHGTYKLMIHRANCSCWMKIPQRLINLVGAPLQDVDGSAKTSDESGPRLMMDQTVEDNLCIMNIEQYK